MTENTNNEKGLQIVDTLLNQSSKDTVALIKTAIESGDNDPAYVGVVLKKFAKVQELVKKDKDLQEIIDSETKKHQGADKTFTLHGAKITVANTGYWDYSLTDDPYLEKMEEIEATMKTMIKARKEAIQSQADIWAKKNNPLAVQEFGLKPFLVTWDDMPKLTWEEGYGESNTNPPIKKGKETLRYTL